MKDNHLHGAVKIIRDERSEKLFDGAEGDLYFLALDHHALDTAVELPRWP